MSFDFGNMNPEQVEAVKHIKGPCRVIAGAGSGKTKVLTSRIAYLTTECGIDPRNILAITFTKKAAEEMKERLIALVGKEIGEEVFLGTFHSFGYKVLRHKMYNNERNNPNAKKQKLELLKDFQQLQILGRILSPSTTVLKKKITNEIDPEVAIGFISWQKNYLIFPQDELDMSCLEDETEITEDLVEDYRNIYEAYERLKKEQGVIDFDDMLIQAYLALKKDRDFRNYYLNRYKYILVDEFQDTNVAQYQMVKLLAGYEQNVFIVGDARQAIYSWRASKVDFILDFEKEWKNAKTVSLNDNYRSTIEVVDMSTESIKYSTVKYPGLCRSGRGNHGEPVFSFDTEDERQEADMIAHLIFDMVENQKIIEYKDVAILYRLNTQSRPLEDAFMSLDIPYYVYGSKSFYDRNEIKELLTYLRLAIAPGDIAAFEDVVNVPDRGITKTVVESLKERANFHGTNILETAETFWNINNNKYGDMILDLVFTVKKIQAMDEDPEKTVTDILNETVTNTNYFDFIEKRFKNKGRGGDDAQDKIEMIKSFIESCARFKHIQQLFDYIDRVKEQNENNAKDKVQLMTIHRSKGLEFDTVFLVGLVNGLLPHGKSIKTDSIGGIIPSSIEEERRLFYVGVTRAKERLFLSTYDHLGEKDAVKSVFYQDVYPKTKDVSAVYQQILEIKEKSG